MDYGEEGANEGDYHDVYEEYQKRYGDVQGDEEGEHIEKLIREQFFDDQIMEEKIITPQTVGEQISDEQLMIGDQTVRDFIAKAEPRGEEEGYSGPQYVESTAKPMPAESQDDVAVAQSPRASCQFDVQELEEEKPFDPAEMELTHAKNYLQTASKATGDNLYDHLTDVLNKILAERPENVTDFFEEYSRKVKERRFKSMTDHLEDIFVEPARYQMAKCMMPWLNAKLGPKPGKKTTNMEKVDMSQNNMLELLYYLEQIGLGLTRQEMSFITLSMRHLVKTEPIVSIRFWGKIFGTFHNYLIVETELKEDEYIKRNQRQKKSFSDTYLYPSYQQPPAPLLEQKEFSRFDKNDTKQEVEGEDDNTDIEQKLPPLPKMEYKELPEPPDEPSGQGLNKKVYYVSNGIGHPWKQLPDVTPREVRISRHIYKSFTGCLDENIQSYPEFPGTEKNYLRAQIARISAGTHIAPIGFYTFDVDLDAPMPRDSGDANYRQPPDYILKNENYEPPKLKQLMDRAFWVHISPYILPQGRASWWRPPSPFPDIEDDESIECECTGGTCVACIAEQVRKIAPETGPPLLTPCCADVSIETTAPWSVKVSSNITDEFALAIMQSNLWPGAYAFTTQGNVFHNVYLGYGLKYLKANFTPLPLSAVQQEYPLGPEVLEVLDEGEPWSEGSEEEEEMNDNWYGMQFEE